MVRKINPTIILDVTYDPLAVRKRDANEIALRQPDTLNIPEPSTQLMNKLNDLGIVRKLPINKKNMKRDKLGYFDYLKKSPDEIYKIRKQLTHRWLGKDSEDLSENTEDMNKLNKAIKPGVITMDVQVLDLSRQNLTDMDMFQIPLAKQLIELNICQTNVTVQGVQWFLAKVPKIKRLKHEAFVEALSILEQSYLQSHKKRVSRKLSLLFADYQNHKHKNGIGSCDNLHSHLRVLSFNKRLVNKVNEIECHLHGESGKMKLASALSRFKNVKKLKLYHLPSQNIMNHMLVNMKYLTVLRISITKVVDFRVINEYCRDLEELYLCSLVKKPKLTINGIQVEGPLFGTLTQTENVIVWKKLRVLSLKGIEQYVMTPTEIISLMASPQLTSVSVEDCSCITDQIMKRIVEFTYKTGIPVKSPHPSRNQKNRSNKRRNRNKKPNKPTKSQSQIIKNNTQNNRKIENTLPKIINTEIPKTDISVQISKKQKTIEEICNEKNDQMDLRYMELKYELEKDDNEFVFKKIRNTVVKKMTEDLEEVVAPKTASKNNIWWFIRNKREKLEEKRKLMLKNASKTFENLKYLSLNRCEYLTLRELDGVILDRSYKLKRVDVFECGSCTKEDIKKLQDTIQDQRLTVKLCWADRTI